MCRCWQRATSDSPQTGHLPVVPAGTLEQGYAKFGLAVVIALCKQKASVNIQNLHTDMLNKSVGVTDPSREIAIELSHGELPQSRNKFVKMFII